MTTLYKKKIKDKKNVLLKVGQLIEVVTAIVHDKTIKKVSFIGRCIAYKKCGINSFIKLRSTFSRVGVEYSVLLYSPSVISIKILNKPLHKVKRAKLYYLKSSN